jgi:predicted dehydrogenase
MRRSGGFDASVLVDLHFDRARTAAQALGVPNPVEGSSLADIALEEIDAITIGTDPLSHASLIEQALEAGKHVICEKPLTVELADAERLATLADERQRVLAVVHNFQFARSMTQLRRWMSQGRLGPIRAIWAMQLSNPRRRLPVWFDRLPLGLFYDESPHLFYLVRALAAADLEVVQAAATPSTIGRENTPSHLAVAMTTSDGVPVTLQMSFEAPVSEWYAAVVGADAVGVVDLFRDIAHFIPNDRGHRALDTLRTSASATWHHWRGYLASGPHHLRGRLLYGNETVFGRFRDAITKGVEPAGISAQDAMAVVRLQHQVVEKATEQLSPA